MWNLQFWSTLQDACEKIFLKYLKTKLLFQQQDFVWNLNFFLFDTLLYFSTANYFSCISVEAISQMEGLNESQKHSKTSAVKM